MEAKVSKVTPSIPYRDNEFEAVIFISIFSHLTERSQNQFLAELYRVCRPSGMLFLTVHGQRALDRAIHEPTIRAILDMEESRFRQAQRDFAGNRHAFVLQLGPLITAPQEKVSLFEAITQTGRTIFGKKVIQEPFEYGITFVPEAYLREHWGEWFEIVDYRYGGIHDFQDIVVMIPKK